MPGPGQCVVSGILYDANTNPLPNTTVLFYNPQQVIGGATIAATTVSTRSDSTGAIAPITLPQTAVVQITVGQGMVVTGIVPAASTATISAVLSGVVFGAISGASFLTNGTPNVSQTSLNLINGTGVTVTNTAGGTVQFTTTPVVEDPSEVTVINTNVESPLFTNTIGANTLGLTKFVQGVIDLSITTMLDGAILTIKLYYGGSLFFSADIHNGTGSTVTTIPVRIAYRLHGRNSTANQGVSATLQLGSTASQLNMFGVGGLFTYSNVTGINIDSTLNQLLQCNALWGAASSSNGVVGQGHDAWLV